MPEEDQERFEDYLELDTYLEALRAGRVVHPPEGITSEQARIYLIALLLNSVSSEAGIPHPAFADALRLHLEQELRREAKRRQGPTIRNKLLRKKHPAVSRRSVLAGGATVAASLVIGAGVGYAIGHSRESTPPPSETPAADDQAIPLVAATAPATWHFVTTLAELGENALRFTSDTVVGYVLRVGDNRANVPLTSWQASAQILAVSAACTHMGCLVQWCGSDRQFHCPCHEALFAANGSWVAAQGAWGPLPPLPQLATKVENGNVYVLIPVRQP